MASGVLYILPPPGRVLRPQHVRGGRRGELSQVRVELFRLNNAVDYQNMYVVSSSSI